MLSQLWSMIRAFLMESELTVKMGELSAEVGKLSAEVGKMSAEVGKLSKDIPTELKQINIYLHGIDKSLKNKQGPH